MPARPGLDQAGTRQVQRADQERNDRGDAGQDAGGTAGPALADRRIGRYDHRQRHEQQQQGAGCVEISPAGQSYLVPFWGRDGALGEPSDAGLGTMSRIGRIRSIGIGKTMVVFFS